jgi:hypothetical protein
MFITVKVLKTNFAQQFKYNLLDQFTILVMLRLYLILTIKILVFNILNFKICFNPNSYDSNLISTLPFIVI